jgi:hypothetical protein
LEEQEKRQVRMVAELKDAIRAGIMSGRVFWPKRYLIVSRKSTRQWG